MTAAHIWLLGCHIQILLNLLQFSFLLFTMAQEEKVKEERGRGLPLSLQSLPGSSTVDSGFLTNIIFFKLVNYFCSFKKNKLLSRLPTFQNCVLILLCNIFILTEYRTKKKTIFFGVRFWHTFFLGSHYLV